MRDFVFAAMPWALCGVAVAILCARLGRRKVNKSKQLEQRLALGASLGLLLGVTWNSFGLWENHAVGLALGPLWGMALAALLEEDDSDGT